MRIFLSWSGERSKKTAKLLQEWLPMVILDADPWMSEESITTGADWSDAIKGALNEADFGIICVTPGNKERPWLLFEAGALSKQVNDNPALVSPFLIDFKSKSELTFPLARFQATEPTKEDMLKLLVALNTLSIKPREKAAIEKMLDMWWPQFAEPYEIIRTSRPATREQRKDRDLLEELLILVRSLSHAQDPPYRLDPSDWTRVPAAMSSTSTLSGTLSPAVRLNVLAQEYGMKLGNIFIDQDGTLMANVLYGNLKADRVRFVAFEAAVRDELGKKVRLQRVLANGNTVDD